MDDIKKQLFINFEKEQLIKISTSNKVLCVIDDVYSELIGVPTDVPFNVLSENVKQNETEYTIDISILGGDSGTAVVKESKVEMYYSSQDVAETAEDFFEPYVDIQDVEDVYSLYDDLDQVEEDFDNEDDLLIDSFFQDEEDFDYDEDEEDEEYDDEDNEDINNFLKNYDQ